MAVMRKHQATHTPTRKALGLNEIVFGRTLSPGDDQFSHLYYLNTAGFRGVGPFYCAVVSAR